MILLCLSSSYKLFSFQKITSENFILLMCSWCTGAIAKMGFSLSSFTKNSLCHFNIFLSRFDISVQIIANFYPNDWICFLEILEYKFSGRSVLIGKNASHSWLEKVFRPNRENCINYVAIHTMSSLNYNVILFHNHRIFFTTRPHPGWIEFAQQFIPHEKAAAHLFLQVLSRNTFTSYSKAQYIPKSRLYENDRARYCLLENFLMYLIFLYERLNDFYSCASCVQCRQMFYTIVLFSRSRSTLNYISVSYLHWHCKLPYLLLQAAAWCIFINPSSRAKTRKIDQLLNKPWHPISKTWKGTKFTLLWS